MMQTERTTSNDYRTYEFPSPGYKKGIIEAYIRSRVHEFGESWDLDHDDQNGKYFLYALRSLTTDERHQLHEPSEPGPSTDKKAGEPSSPLRKSADKVVHADVSEAELDSLEWDDDDYILNPAAYYERLETLEKTVFKSSEFYRCEGNYDLENDDLSTIPKDLQSNKLIEACLVNPSQNEAGLNHLIKSYSILCGVIQCFDSLVESHFCTSFYTVLFADRYAGTTVVRTQKVKRDDLIHLRSCIEDALSNEQRVSPLFLHFYMARSPLFSAKLLPINPDKAWQLRGQDLLSHLRFIITLLDLGIVSYVGSHTSNTIGAFPRYSTHDLIVHHPTMKVGFNFRPVNLTCLHEFLDGKAVWVFETFSGNATTLLSNSSKLSVLTQMDEFADLWGPVWAVPAEPDRKVHVRQYNVSKGFISRVEGQDRPGPVMCHWFPHSRASARQRSTVTMTMRKGDRLLIGSPHVRGPFRENKACRYILDDFEKDYGLKMQPLGTQGSAWKIDTRSLGITGTFHVGVTATGTQKLRPQTTLKEHVWDQWSNNPCRANPGVFLQFTGLEISNCTGNARRIQLKDLFSIRSIQQAIDSRLPGWRETIHYSDLTKILSADDEQTFYNLWRSFTRSRSKIAEIFCCVLEILDKTGVSDGRFWTGFINDTREYLAPLELPGNTWAKLLRDSHLTATYAMVNEICLECPARGHDTAICSSTIAFTALQTRLALPQHQPLRGHFDLGPLGMLRTTSENEDSMIIMKWESNPHELKESVRDGVRRMRTSLGIKTSPASSVAPLERFIIREVLDESQLGGRKIHVVIRANTATYGGLSTARKHKARERTKPPTSVRMDSIEAECSQNDCLARSEHHGDDQLSQEERWNGVILGTDVLESPTVLQRIRHGRAA